MNGTASSGACSRRTTTPSWPRSPSPSGARRASPSRSATISSRRLSSPVKETEIADASPAALAGKAIGTIEGSQHAAFLKARYPEADLRTYAKLDEAELDLLTERIDLVLGDKLALSRFLQSREGGCCRFAGEPAVDAAFYGEGVAVGLRKEDKELKELFNRALERIKADGTYDRIRAKYFAFDTK